MSTSIGTAARRLGVVLAVLFGVGVFTSLGVWQLHRLTWKLALIAQVQHNTEAMAIAAPAPGTWSPAQLQQNNYRHVTVHGVFMNNAETLVHASTELGMGYWVITPLKTRQGYTVLINRGFVPLAHKNPTTRKASLINTPTTVTGLLRLSEPKGTWLQKNHPAQNRWYSRDVAAITAAHHLSNTAPYFIDADSTPNPGGLPVGGLTVIHFRNQHLQYAITWFALAALLAGASLGIAWYRPKF